LSEIPDCAPPLRHIIKKSTAVGSRVVGSDHAQILFMGDKSPFRWDSHAGPTWIQVIFVGVRKSDEVPEHKIPEPMYESSKEMRTRNLRKFVLASKVVNPFTRALAPPFIERRRDFYIPRLPLNLKNIRSVNMYTNVFYIP
jgi:hypothetical protein